MGSPSVTLTVSPKASALIGGSPWSWYMASTASQDRSRRGVKAVSAGTGPLTASPCSASDRSKGCTISISSRPRTPSSPACGFSPSTMMRGESIPNRARRSSCSTAMVACSRSAVIAPDTPLSGRCVVTRATRRFADASIITGQAAPVRAASHSV